MSTLVILLLTLGIIVYVGSPLWTRQPKKPVTARHKVDAAPRADVDELELDRRVGRLDAQDYSALRGSAQPAGEEDEIERRVRALRQERKTRQRVRTRDRGQERS
jgi:hypothetical protein